VVGTDNVRAGIAVEERAAEALGEECPLVDTDPGRRAGAGLEEIGDDAGIIAKISLLSSPEAKKAIRAEVEQKIESGQIDSADPKLIKALFSAAQAAVTGALKRA
jgi:hypothetical protein